MIEACIIDFADRNHKEYLPTLSCIGQELLKSKTLPTTDEVLKAASNCWEKHMPGIPYSRIENCTKVNCI